MTIEPGAEGQVEASPSARPVATRETIPIWIETNVPDIAVVQFAMTGLVNLKALWRPPSASFYGEKPTKLPPKEILFFANGGKKIEFSTEAVSSPDLLVSWHDAEADKRICRIELAPSCAKGNRTEYV